jgi:DNA-binding Lrp family transcriptional regulator
LTSGSDSQYIGYGFLSACRTLSEHGENNQAGIAPGGGEPSMAFAPKGVLMITALVMINCEVGKVPSVSEALMGLEGVAEVYSISGNYDIMAIIRVKEYDSLADVVSENIARIKGITATHTHMAFRCYSKHDMEKMWSSYLEP